MQIRLEHVHYTYQPGTAGEKHALRDVSLQLEQGEYVALVGSTGSGKSTLVQLLNGLKQPTSGSILYDGLLIGNDKKALRQIRCRVGLVFQYPEYQLFDETVIRDVTFGPKNKGLSAEEASRKAREALLQTGLPEELFGKSPFDLSGGEKRRAAIAGILAMEPEVLILDEPTAGLDPAGKVRILELIRRIRKETGCTILMVTHNMDEAAEYAERILVMDEGQIILDGDPHEVFAREEQLKRIGLCLPQAAQVCLDLGIRGCTTLEEAAKAIAEAFGPGHEVCSEISH